MNDKESIDDLIKDLKDFLDDNEKYKK